MIGKLLKYAAYGAGGAVLAVGAVAAAPFTGGGSILGAATLAGSLAGAGAVATGAGAAAAAGGAYVAKRNDDDEEEKKRKYAKNSLETEKAKEALKEHEKHTNYILALSAFAMAMANSDGEIAEVEKKDLNDFIGGLSSDEYPKHIVNQIQSMYDNPPSFNEALKHLNKIDIENYGEIRNLLVTIMESDGYHHPREKAFIAAFDTKIREIN